MNSCGIFCTNSTEEIPERIHARFLIGISSAIPEKISGGFPEKKDT